MTIQHGFHATITAQPGQGGALAELLLAAPALTQPDCVVFLISRSAADPDTVVPRAVPDNRWSPTCPDPRSTPSCRPCSASCHPSPNSPRSPSP